MAKAKPQKQEPSVAVAEAPEEEDRIDEFAIEIFKHLGLEGRLPGSLVTIYNDFKRTRDTLTPRGRLPPESFATIVTLYRLLSADR